MYFFKEDTRKNSMAIFLYNLIQSDYQEIMLSKKAKWERAYVACSLLCEKEGEREDLHIYIYFSKVAQDEQILK